MTEEKTRTTEIITVTGSELEAKYTSLDLKRIHLFWSLLACGSKAEDALYYCILEQEEDRNEK